MVMICEIFAGRNMLKWLQGIQAECTRVGDSLDLHKVFANTGVFVPSFIADSSVWFEERMGNLVWRTGSVRV